MINYAKSFIGKPYIWAGSGPVGFDCSGFIIEVLQAFGHLPKGDWTADGLFKKLKELGWTEVPLEHARGADVVFFISGKKYSHVAMMVNPTQYIEAGGGTSNCKTPETSSGMVRLRPLSWRQPTVALRSPAL